MKQDGEISEFDGVDLLIFPLKKDELKLLLDDSDAFSKYINLCYDGEDVKSDIMQFVLKYKYNELCKDETNLAFNSMWTICSLSKRAIVGLIDFKAMTNENGEVEIGYGIGEKHRNEGYATLAVELLCNYAKEHNIKTILADTEKTNIASQKVLEKNFFDKTGEDENLCYYKKELK